MVGCRLVRRDGSFDHAAKRSFPTPLSALAHFTGVGRRANAPRALAQYRAPDLDEYASGEVDAVNGAFMLVRRAAMDEVGLLDEGYWFYMEDLDWCYRFKQHGWKVWYDGGTTVIHVKGGATVRLGASQPAKQLPLPPFDGALLPQVLFGSPTSPRRRGLRGNRRQVRGFRRAEFGGAPKIELAGTRRLVDFEHE